MKSISNLVFPRAVKGERRDQGAGVRHVRALPARGRLPGFFCLQRVAEGRKGWRLRHA